MMSALHVASARLSFLWILCLNDLIHGNLCRNIFYIHVFFLFWFSNVILSVALILPVSQLQRERASESLIRSHIEYLIQTYYIDTDSTQHVRPPGFSTACGLTAWDNTEPRDPKPVWTCFQALIRKLNCSRRVSTSCRRFPSPDHALYRVVQKCSHYQIIKKTVKSY